VRTKEKGKEIEKRKNEKAGTKDEKQK